MRSGRAPDGFITEVEITVTLRAHSAMAYAWTTPINLTAALHRALRWAKHDMRVAGIRGRSQIVGVEVHARYVPGVYNNAG